MTFVFFTNSVIYFETIHRIQFNFYEAIRRRDVYRLTNTHIFNKYFYSRFYSVLLFAADREKDRRGRNRERLQHDVFPSLKRDVSRKNKRRKFDSLTLRATKVMDVAMQTVKIQADEKNGKCVRRVRSNKLMLSLAFARAQRERSRHAHKVILGREKFVDGTSLPVSYEVSPFRGRS